MCYGSFILTIFWVIREILDLMRQFKWRNSLLSFVGSFAEWILTITQACWEIAGTNCNYVSSMFGFGYCTSTRRTIELTDNALQQSIGLVGNTLIYLCVLMTAMISAVVGVMAIEIEPIGDKIRVGFVLFFISFGLAWMLLSVYVNVTRAIYMCICIDIESKGLDQMGDKDSLNPNIGKYLAIVPKFCPPPPPPVQAPPPILPKGRRYEEDSEEEEEEEEVEQMVQIIEV